MDAILKSLRTAIEMARATMDDPAYVARRLEEIEWGVDALLADRGGKMMNSERVNEIRAALDAATQGEWKWHGIAAPNWMPNTVIAVDGLRVETPMPDKFYDADVTLIIEGMKSGFMMVRNADADLIANAPAYLRDLLAENARLNAVVEAARAIVADADSPQLARNWATDRLATALAAMGEGE